MAVAREQLDRQAVAERCGLASVKVLDVYRARGIVPDPDGHVGRSPWWWSTSIDRWNRRRRRVTNGHEA